MSYTSKTLLPDENVLYKGHVSAWYFAPALLLALIGAVVLIFALARKPVPSHIFIRTMTNSPDSTFSWASPSCYGH